MLQIKNLSVKLGDSQVLKGLSLQVPQGQIYGLFGTNGSGKTTLFECLYKNIKHTGLITLNNSPLQKRSISYLQSQTYFYDYITANDLIGLSKDDKLSYLLNLFEVPTKRIYKELSFGTRKKMNLAINLSLDKTIYLLDEPFFGVDVQSIEKIKTVLLDLNKQSKITIINSHQVNDLTTICQTIGHLEKGEIKTELKQPMFESLFDK